MSLEINEYLGIDIHTVDKVECSSDKSYCPFTTSHVCYKAKTDAPICSVLDNRTGIVWASCQHRVCSSLKNKPISKYQVSVLKDIGKALYGDDNISIGMEKHFTELGATPDVIMKAKNKYSVAAPEYMLVELQFSGSTIGMKDLKGICKNACGSTEKDNKRYIDTSDLLSLSVSGQPCIDNALKTILVHSCKEMHAVNNSINKLGMAMCVSKPLYDYIIDNSKFNSLSIGKQPDFWNVAIVTSDNAFKIDIDKTAYTTSWAFMSGFMNQNRSIDDELVRFSSYMTRI